MTSTSSNSPFRVGVVGAGMMGADHVKRIASKISGAEVSAVVDPDESRRASALTNSPGALGFSSIEDALDEDAVDGVLIATPGHLHEPVLYPAIEAGIPVLCEKPLTPDPESALRVTEAERSHGRKLIQVGFMRRFDPEYRQLRQLVESESSGDLLMLHCAHRNPSVPDDYTQDTLIDGSVVHEFDVVPWLAGSHISAIEVKEARRNRLTPDRLTEPLLILIELESGVLVDVEINVSVQFGYQVTTEAVFGAGIARIGDPAGMQSWSDGRSSFHEHRDFTTRFATAYDTQVQAWVDAARHGSVGGPDAWDGYRVAVACEAGVAAMNDGKRHTVDIPDTPDFYL